MNGTYWVRFVDHEIGMHQEAVRIL